MLASLSFVFLAGLAMAALCKRLRLPGIVGMLLTGVALGPYALNLLDPSLLNISGELRQMALIIILVKAGLSLDLSDLKKVGRPAVLMSCLPAGFEILGYVLLAPCFLELTRTEAAVLGAVLAAVSPAVVVPRMLKLMEEGRGAGKSIPQLILAGASCDDVFVIVLFSAFAGMAQGEGVRLADFAGIPVSILLGVVLGGAAGLLLATFFQKKSALGDTLRTILILSTAFLLMAAETWAKGTVPLSGLLAVVSMACVLKKKLPAVSRPLSEKFGKLWLGAEVLLFVLVGAAVDIRYTLEAGLPAVGLILLALLFRAAGVLLCLAGTDLTWKERLFCIIAYLPKATVQAAMGGVPLTMGLSCGKTVLSVAVLAILITAPLGALGIDRSAPHLLSRESSTTNCIK